MYFIKYDTTTIHLEQWWHLLVYPVYSKKSKVVLFSKSFYRLWQFCSVEVDGQLFIVGELHGAIPCQSLDVECLSRG